jgi:hypothetical protein
MSVAMRLNVHSSREPFYSGVCESVKGSAEIPSIIHDGDWAAMFISLPVIVLSFPLDVAFDTICFPFDLYIYLSRDTVKKERHPRQSQAFETE